MPGVRAGGRGLGPRTRAATRGRSGSPEARPGYFQSERQNPPRSARPSATFLARRATRRGLPLAIALMLSEIRAAR